MLTRRAEKPDCVNTATAQTGVSRASEATARIDAALALPHATEHPTECMLAEEAAGGIAWWSGEYETCLRHYEAALGMARDLGDDV